MKDSVDESVRSDTQNKVAEAANILKNEAMLLLLGIFKSFVKHSPSLQQTIPFWHMKPVDLVEKS